jgi:hypothetical protein
VRRLLAGLLAGVVIALSTQGCDISMHSNDHTNADDCSDVSYDLTTPPSRVDLGMGQGDTFVDKSCDAGFALDLTLPTGASTSLTARRVNADSHSASDPATDPPTTIDVHSVALTTADAVRVADGIADDLGIDAGALQTWRQQVEGSESGDSVDSPFLRNTLGYLTVELQVQHLGVSGNNYLHLVLNLR